jgi:hypothetical protein
MGTETKRAICTPKKIATSFCDGERARIRREVGEGEKEVGGDAGGALEAGTAVERWRRERGSSARARALPLARPRVLQRCARTFEFTKSPVPPLPAWRTRRSSVDIVLRQAIRDDTRNSNRDT